jgi:1,4-dihydroxy-2-naphthoyl-CoA hydrolase
MTTSNVLKTTDAATAAVPTRVGQQPAELPDLTATGGFLQAAGLRLDEVTGTRVSGSIELTAAQHTPWGVVHGGVYTTAAETAASVGASTAVADLGQFAVGVHNSTDFLRAATGGTVTVTATPVQQGRVQQLWHVAITRDDGKELARAQVRLQNVVRPTPAEGARL